MTNAACPGSDDASWEAWARPLAAVLAESPRTRGECDRIGLALGMTTQRAQSLLPWLELRGLAEVTSGSAALTPTGLAWAWAGGAAPALPSVLPTVPRPRGNRGVDRSIDLRPYTYGRLHPIERAGRSASGNAYWLCACDCGNPTLVLVSARHLRSKHTRSCGCLSVSGAREFTVQPPQWIQPPQWRTEPPQWIAA